MTRFVTGLIIALAGTIGAFETEGMMLYACLFATFAGALIAADSKIDFVSLLHHAQEEKKAKIESIFFGVILPILFMIVFAIIIWTSAVSGYKELLIMLVPIGLLLSFLCSVLIFFTLCHLGIIKTDEETSDKN